jgi:predicted phage-related endonuclease
MKIEKFSSSELWLEARRGRITGTRLGDIIPKRGTGEKAGFYELVAEKMARPEDGENPMDRGHRLEEEALDRFEAETGKKVCRDFTIMSREDHEGIAVSPDGYVFSKSGKITECLEVKCLASWRHIKIFLENEKIPSEFREQYAQYFVVDDNLKTLFAIFYDPRMIVRDFFFREIKRSDFAKEELDNYLEIEIEKLKKVDEIVNVLCEGTELRF